MRKNKCGQWNVLELDRKGYRWGMINYLTFPDKIIKVTQEDIKDRLFESTRCFKSKQEIIDVHNNRSVKCIERKQFYAEESAKLNNSVLTLQQWGDMIIESNKGDKDE